MEPPETKLASLARARGGKAGGGGRTHGQLSPRGEVRGHTLPVAVSVAPAPPSVSETTTSTASTLENPQHPTTKKVVMLTHRPRLDSHAAGLLPGSTAGGGRRKIYGVVSFAAATALAAALAAVAAVLAALALPPRPAAADAPVRTAVAPAPAPAATFTAIVAVAAVEIPVPSAAAAAAAGRRRTRPRSRPLLAAGVREEIFVASSR